MAEPLALPEPSSEPLKQAPLELVVCQVQHDRTLAVGDASRALKVSDRLRKAFGERLSLEDQTQQELAFAAQPQGLTFPMQPQQTSGWRLQAVSGDWVVVIMPDFFALESTGYTSWQEFRKRFIALVQAILKEFGPAIERRLGLRYVDRISDSSVKSLGDWSGLIDDRLLGPAKSSTFGDSIIQAQQILQLTAPNSYEAILRHGPQRAPDGNWNYLLDTDCYRSLSDRLEEDNLVEGADSLHRLAVQLFQASITPEYRRTLEVGESS